MRWPAFVLGALLLWSIGPGCTRTTHPTNTPIVVCGLESLDGEVVEAILFRFDGVVPWANGSVFTAVRELDGREVLIGQVITVQGKPVVKAAVLDRRDTENLCELTLLVDSNYEFRVGSLGISNAVILQYGKDLESEAVVSAGRHTFVVRGAPDIDIPAEP